tara:strand:- start:405 stop:1661 length:1257 start_codon:yes stop_codon:yes gene_type:complete
MQKKIISLQSFLTCLIPIALISGPAIPDIIVSFLAIIFIFSTFRYKLFKYYLNPIIIILFVFYFYLFISSLFSNHVLHSLESTLFYSRFIFFSLSCWYVIEKSNNFNHRFLFSISFSIIVLIIDGFIQYFYGSNLLGFPYNGDRLSSFFGDELKLGSYLSRLMPIFLAFITLIYFENKKIIFFALLLFILSDLLIVFSGERTSLFYLIFSSFVIIILIKKWKFYRFLALIISSLLIFFIFSTNSKVSNRIITQTLKQTNIVADDVKDINLFTIQHQVLYVSAYRIFNDNKIIGIGPKNFRIVCKNKKYEVLTDKDGSIDGCQTHPHNIYIQLLAETGLIGFLIIFSFFIYLLYILSKHLINIILKQKYIFSDFQICLFVAILITLWPFVPTGNFFNNWLNIIFYLPLGFLLHSFKHKY